MWNAKDFQDVIDWITVATCQEDVCWIKEILRHICRVEDKAKLWSMLADWQKDLLKHPEYLPTENELNIEG